MAAASAAGSICDAVKAASTFLASGHRAPKVAAASAAGSICDAAKAASTFWRPVTERPKWLRLQPQVRFAIQLKQHPLLVPSHRRPKVAAASAAGSICDAAKAASTFWRPVTERPKWLRLQPQVRFATQLKQHPLFGTRSPSAQSGCGFSRRIDSPASHSPSHSISSPSAFSPSPSTRSGRSPLSVINPGISRYFAPPGRKFGSR
jgi:hypothetical protein